MKRDQIIATVASAIPRDAGHKADLANPDRWIIVEVHKNIAAIGVVENYERFKKLNVQTVAQATNASKSAAADQDHGGRVAASLKPKHQDQAE